MNQITSPEGKAPKVPRADAQRNRARVLAAAHEVFAAEGLSVNVDVIARRAGVGVGTLYRHFPTKEALFEAIVLADLEAFVELARSLADADEPGEALYGYLTRIVDHSETSAAVKDALGGVFAVGRYAADTIGDIEDALAVLLERAQAAGETRTDVCAGELLALLAAAYHASNSRARGSVSCTRLVSVICDGLRLQPVPRPLTPLAAD
jgi:AcrR family transcriptional regulator